MQFSAIYGRITDYSQDETSTAATRAKYAANDAVLRIAGKKSWDILKRSGNIAFASDRTYSVIGAYTDLNYVTRVWYISNGIRQEIELVDDARFSEVQDTSGTGTPEFARNTYLSGVHLLELNITPSSAFQGLYVTMYFEYQKVPDTLTLDADIPEIPHPSQHMAIVYFATAEVCAQQGDRGGINYWEAKGQDLLASAFKHDIKKKGSSLKMARPVFGIYGQTGRFVKRDDYDTI